MRPRTTTVWGMVVATLAGGLGCAGARDEGPREQPVIELPIAEAPSFRALGALPGYAGSDGLAISNDGATVVGRTWTLDGPGQAFTWTAADGMTGLGFLDGFSTSGARAVSRDGSTVVGFASEQSAMAPWRWTRATGMTRLLGGEAISPCTVSGVSADGSALVGATNCFGGSEAYLWTKDEGLRGLGWLAPDADPRMSEAKGVSADGAVIVGQSTAPGGLDTRRAFRWTAAEGLVELPNLPGSDEAIAWAVSPNGRCVVGHALLANGAGVAAMWTTGRTTKLGGPEGPRALTIAHAVSDDCSVVVGETGDGGDSTDAFVWTAARGMERLRDRLPAGEVASWSLVRANGLSPDGRRIVGMAQAEGREPTAFLATLP